MMTMEHIADWLKQRGMSEYAQRFVENRIDLSVLPDLTDQDLEKLGSCLAIAARYFVGLPISKLVRISPCCRHCACGTCCAGPT